ncbi:MAG: VWA domain-containing protein [Candidatus Endonucleobacter bathymodioli]|uniref:VWA domain-containing protein n=1 Tax=Candidatus Endonucleibacter bathymodioli TaxID=539814 RepID=A0AA90SSZ8_9GAMM|nr:VWA domain-containing protein [Candidatus Endonucleobacter bathymodioli]
MLELEWPWVFLAIPAPLLIYKLIPPAAKINEQALRIPFYRELVNTTSACVLNDSRSSRKILFTLWSMWLLLLLTASQPKWLGEPVQLKGSGRDLMLAVDLSGSMEIRDMAVNNQEVDRLSATKWVLSDFIERRNGDRIGLILFGSQAYLQTPLTFDRKTVQTLMDEADIGMAGNKTAIGDAIGLAVKHLRTRPEDSRVLILLTDGANTAGQITPIQAAKLAQEEQIKIYSIGIGAEEMVQPGLFGSSIGARTVNPSADLDEKTLREIATLTKGKYFRARDTSELDKIYKLLDKLEPVDQEEEVFRPEQSLYPWPLALALIISLLMAFIHVLPVVSYSSRRLS